MTHDPMRPTWEDAESSEDSTDLFGKLDSLIQKHQGRSARRAAEAVPMLTEPVEGAPPTPEPGIPVLEDAVDSAATEDQRISPVLAHARRQLQIALYVRLRQRLDSELDAALADNLRLGAVAVDPDFSRIAQELRSVLPIVVRESVEQVLDPESLAILLSGSTEQGDESP